MYEEQIKALLATKKQKGDRMRALAAASTAEGRSMNPQEATEFDSMKAECLTIDGDVKRLSDLVAMDTADAASATAVDQALAQRSTVTGATRVQTTQLATVEKLQPGIAFARYAMILGQAKGNKQVAFELVKRQYPKTEAIVHTLKAQAEGADLVSLLRQKATVPAGTTTDSVWAGPLVYAENFMGDFIDYLRPRTLIGQAAFRPVPFNVRIPKQVTGGSANWVGQGKAKPLTSFQFGSESIPFTKIASITVLTQELVRFSSPSAEALVRDSLADTVIAKIDGDLFDPDLAAVSGVNPAGLLNGVSPVAGPPASGVDAEEIRCALLRLWAPWDSTFMGARPAYYTTPAVARVLSFMKDPLGAQSFPGVTPQGGTLMGIPVRVSQYLANNGGSGGAPLILVDESEIYLADDGQVTIDMSDQVSLEMSDAPAHDSGTPTPAQLVSMWQTDSIALKAERFIWWGKRRTGAVQWIDGFPSSCT